MRISDWSSDVGGIEPGPPCSLGNRDVQPAHMIDQAELARRCARPDATLPDFVHARGRHLAGNGHAGEEAAVYILDRKLQELDRQSVVEGTSVSGTCRSRGSPYH